MLTRSRAEFSVIAVSSLACLAVAHWNSDDAVDEAAATLAAAVIGVAGTFAGHKTGHSHGPPAGSPSSAPALTAVATIAGTVLAGLAAQELLPMIISMSGAAAAGLSAAVVGVVATLFVHDRWIRSSEPSWTRPALFGGTVVGCVALVVWSPAPISTDGAAAFAAALIGVAGTVLAHPAGRRLA